MRLDIFRQLRVTSKYYIITTSY